MVQDCRICFGGAIGRMALQGSLRRRFCHFLVSCPFLIFDLLLEEEEGVARCGGRDADGIWTDADVIGLWADIETAVYKELKSQEAGGRKSGSWDGYHQEFVARSE